MRRRKRITDELVEKWINQWTRINFESDIYYSFIKTQDIVSNGLKNRSPDYIIPHQDRNFLSINESLFFLELLFDERIKTIKEQYPLLPRNNTQLIAKKFGIRHPTYPFTSSVKTVMTTDFLCETIFGQQVIYSIKEDDKSLTEKQKKRQDDKLKIEKAFWLSKGANWHLVLSSEIKTVRNENLEKLAPFVHLSKDLTHSFPSWLEIAHKVISRFINSSCVDFLEQMSHSTKLCFDDSVACFQHALWHRHIQSNLSTPLDYAKTLAELEVCNAR